MLPDLTVSPRSVPKPCGGEPVFSDAFLVLKTRNQSGDTRRNDAIFLFICQIDQIAEVPSEC